jgi:cytochrome c oxidase assembly protein subunit 15
MQTFVRRLAVANAAVMLLVLIQGAMVTNTGSADGCGNSWPLCHGEFIPQYTFSTAIEFSHRFVTTIATVLILGTAAGALWFYRQRREIRIYVPIMIFFLFLQAGLGAAAVMWPQSDEVLALHFGISLIAFASTVLVAAHMYGIDSWDKLRDRPVPAKVRWVIWGLTAYTYVVVYLGAYVRHTEASLACSDWPLCNGSVFPGFSGPIGVAFSHRVAAGVLVISMGALLWTTLRMRAYRPDLFWGSVMAVGFVAAQAIGGALIVLTQLDFFATMSHSVLVALFFGTMTFMCVHVLPRPAEVRAAAPASAPSAVPATAGSLGD